MLFRSVAHGVPARVVKLRALGNAIVPQVAAEFVMASCEAASLVRWAAGAGRGAEERVNGTTAKPENEQALPQAGRKKTL